MRARRVTIRAINRYDPSLAWSFEVSWWPIDELVRLCQFRKRGRTDYVAVLTILEARVLHRQFRAEATDDQAAALWRTLRVRHPTDWLVVIDVEEVVNARSDRRVAEYRLAMLPLPTTELSSAPALHALVLTHLHQLALIDRAPWALVTTWRHGLDLHRNWTTHRRTERSLRRAFAVTPLLGQFQATATVERTVELWLFVSGIDQPRIVELMAEHDQALAFCGNGADGALVVLGAAGAARDVGRFDAGLVARTIHEARAPGRRFLGFDQ